MTLYTERTAIIPLFESDIPEIFIDVLVNYLLNSSSQNR